MLQIGPEICHCPCCRDGIEAPHEYHLERRPMAMSGMVALDRALGSLLAHIDANTSGVATAATLRWCDHCGEGVTDFCRGKSEACPMQFKKLRTSGVEAARD